MRGPLTRRGWAAILALLLVAGLLDGWRQAVHIQRERDRYFAAGVVVGECRIFRGAVKANPVLLWPGKPDVKAALDACTKVPG